MKRILVVDDEPASSRVVKLGLERAGYEVDLARNGEEALEQLEKHEYQALVTDLCMPRMDGRTLVERISAGGPGELFIVVMTSRPEDEFRDWAGTLERICFLEKPVSLRRLTARLEEILGD
jgi:CheY-like chemotaxis protein